MCNFTVIVDVVYMKHLKSPCAGGGLFILCKVAFPQGRDPVGSHCLQESALKTDVKGERCASNMVWTEEETFGNMKKKNGTFFKLKYKRKK